MLRTQRGNHGLRSRPVSYRLDATDEPTFFDENFALDSGRNAVHNELALYERESMMRVVKMNHIVMPPLIRFMQALDEIHGGADEQTKDRDDQVDR